MKTYLEIKKEEIMLSCKKCQGTDSKCDCAKLFRLELQKEGCNIPPRFRDVDILKIKMSPEHRLLVNEFVNQPNKNILLRGGQKLKRTNICASLLIGYLKLGYNGKFIDLAKCIDGVANEWFHNKQDFYKEIIGSDIVVFSDVGDERRGDNHLVEDIFDGILKERIYNLKKTIISTSMTLPELSLIYTKDRQDLIEESFAVLSFDKVNTSEIFEDKRK